MVGVIVKTRPSASCRALKIDSAQNGMAAAEKRRFLPSPAPILLRGRGEPLIAYTIQGRIRLSDDFATDANNLYASIRLASALSLFLGAPL